MKKIIILILFLCIPISGLINQSIYADENRHIEKGRKLAQEKNYAAAVDEFKKALEIQLIELGENHPDVIANYIIIGRLYQINNEYDKAIGYYEKTLTYCLNKQGKDHLDTARCYNIIGDLYYAKEEYDKAIDFYNKALSIRLIKLGNEHSEVITLYNSLGNSYYIIEDWNKALEYYEMTLVISKKVYGENSKETATVYNNIGLACNKNREYDKALNSHSKSLSIRLNIFGKDHLVTADSYNNIGIAYRAQGDYGKAIENFSTVLMIEINKLGEENPEVALIYDNLGGAYHLNGEYSRALENYEKAYEIRIVKLGKDHTDTAKSYNNIGSIFLSIGEYDKAIEDYGKALSIFLTKSDVDQPVTATIYNNIGLAYQGKGDYDKALGFYEKAIAIRLIKLGKNHPDTATTYVCIGYTYYSKGEYEKALDFYEKALVIERETLGENHPDIAACYNNIGLVYHSRYEYGKALDCYKKSLDICINKLGNNHPYTSQGYNNIGNVYIFTGEYNKALAYFEKALSINLNKFGGNHPNTAQNYNNIGGVYGLKGEYENAIINFEKAQRIFNNFSSRQEIVEVSLNLGLLNLERKDFNKAQLAFDQGIAIVEKSRTDMNSGKMDFMSRNINLYYYYLKTCFEMNDTSTAFAMSESMRSRGFLERLSLSMALESEGIKKQERELLKKLNDDIVSLSSRRGLWILKDESKEKSEMIIVLSKELEVKEKAFDEMDEKLMKNEKYKNLRKPHIATYKEAQNLCTNNSAILEYVIWENNEKKNLANKLKQSYCIIISKDLDKPEIIKLDPDYKYSDEIDKYRTYISDNDAEVFIIGENNSGKTRVFPWYTSDAKAVSYVIDDVCYDPVWYKIDKPTPYIVEADGKIYQVTMKSECDSGKFILKSKIDTGYKRTGLVNKNKKEKISELSLKLYDKLIRPVESALKNKTKITIVPDGPLAFLPFDTLKKNKDDKYLCETFEISMSPSVSVMLMVKGRNYSSGRKAMLTFGGAVYAKDEISCKDSSTRGSFFATRSPSKKEQEYNAGLISTEGASRYFENMGFEWNNLSGSLEEVEAVAAKVYKPGDVTVYKNRDVTEKNVKTLSKNNGLSNYRNILFSCHGYFDKDFPSCSSVIFSEVSGKVQTGEDGYLTVEDAALLNIKADMVNLSACETGLGGIVKGDGIVGLTRAFQVAGANSVGVTLWQVDDEATKDFMVSVYSKVEKSRMSFSDAIQKTKIEFIGNSKYGEPYFWSTFVLYGE